MIPIEPYMWSNLTTLGLLVALWWLARVVERNRLWREAFAELWARRRFAILVVGFYLLVALLDSVSWKGGVPEGAVGVLPNAPLSVLDRVFVDTQEASYSAPFAEKEFYGGKDSVSYTHLTLPTICSV